MAEEIQELSDAAKSEIAAAIAILKSDGLHIHKTAEAYANSKKEKDDKTPPDSDSGNDGGENDKDGNPPPKKEEENEKPKKAGLWWADRSSE